MIRVRRPQSVVSPVQTVPEKPNRTLFVCFATPRLNETDPANSSMGLSSRAIQKAGVHLSNVYFRGQVTNIQRNNSYLLGKGGMLS